MEEGRRGRRARLRRLLPRHAGARTAHGTGIRHHHHHQQQYHALTNKTMLTLRLHCVYTAPTTRTPTTRTLHCTASPRAPCQVRASRLQPSSDSDYRYASRSVPLPNPGEADLPSEIAPPQARRGPRRGAARRVPHAEGREVGCRPRSALTPGALRAAREVESVRERDS